MMMAKMWCWTRTAKRIVFNSCGVKWLSTNKNVAQYGLHTRYDEPQRRLTKPRMTSFKYDVEFFEAMFRLPPDEPIKEESVSVDLCLHKVQAGHINDQIALKLAGSLHLLDDQQLVMLSEDVLNLQEYDSQDFHLLLFRLNMECKRRFKWDDEASPYEQLGEDRQDKPNSLVPTADQSELAYDLLLSSTSSKTEDIQQTKEEIDLLGKSLIDLTPQQLGSLKNDQLVRVIVNFSSLHGNSDDFRGLLAGLDNECCRRLEGGLWDVATSFQILLAMPSRFNLEFQLYHKVVTHWANEVVTDAFPASELATYFSFLKVGHSFPPGFARAKMESRLSSVLDQLSLQELGVISEAYVLCKRGLRSLPLIDRIASRLVNEVTSADDKTVCFILELFRKSTGNVGYPNSQAVLDLQSRLYPHIDRFSPMAMTRLVSVTNKVPRFHTPSIERVAERFLSFPTGLKDLARLTSVLAVSNHRSANTEQFWTSLPAELMKHNRQDEIKTHPAPFISLMLDCAMAGHYSADLLNLVFQPDAIQSALRKSVKSKIQGQLLALHRAVEIEFPAYDGPRLTQPQLLEFRNLNEKISPGDRSLHKQFLLALLDTTKEVLGSNQSVAASVLLPHFSLPDVQFASHGVDQLTALVVGSQHLYRNGDSNEEPLGPLAMKVRQLERSGYRVHLVPWHQFAPLDGIQQLVYVRQLVQQEQLKQDEVVG